MPAETDADRARKRQEIMRIISEGIRRDMDAAAERRLMGLPSHRTFVCQGCGEASVVLYGSRMKCHCGVTSAAEVPT